jgi:hypothetical protein
MGFLCVGEIEVQKSCIIFNSILYFFVSIGGD